MKFLCVQCDRQMVFEERQLPGDGTLTVVFRCPRCGRLVAMLANPMETHLVTSLGVEVGGRSAHPQPLESLRASLATARDDALAEGPADGGRGTGVTWSPEAVERLSQVPAFVRDMVKTMYEGYARDHGVAEITPATMDAARKTLGL